MKKVAYYASQYQRVRNDVISKIYSIHVRGLKQGDTKYLFNVPNVCQWYIKHHKCRYELFS